MSLQLSIREELWNLDPSDRLYVDLYADETDQEHTLK